MLPLNFGAQVNWQLFLPSDPSADSKHHNFSEPQTIKEQRHRSPNKIRQISIAHQEQDRLPDACKVYNLFDREQRHTSANRNRTIRSSTSSQVTPHGKSTRQVQDMGQVLSPQYLFPQNIEVQTHLQVHSGTPRDPSAVTATRTSSRTIPFSNSEHVQGDQLSP